MLGLFIMVALISAIVFLLIGRAWQRGGKNMWQRVKAWLSGMVRRIPLIILAPVAWQILRRVIWILLRLFLFRR